MIHKIWKSDNRGCVCEREEKIVDLVADTGCTKDEAAVAALPENWIPKHAGVTLANYLKARKASHDDTSRDLLKEASVVNDTVDSKIRAIAEALLAYIQQNQCDMNCVVERNNIEDGKPLSPQARDVALQCIRQFHSARVEEITKFRLEALSLEKERVEGLKQVLRNNFQCLIAVGHKPPRDLLHDFDDQAYEINQQLLSNSRAYAELEAQLRLQADESMVRFKSNLNQLCLGVSITCRRQSARPSIMEKAEMKRPTTSIGENHRHSSQFGLQNIIINRNTFDMEALVDAYTRAIQKVFGEVSDNLTDLFLHVGCPEYFGKEPTPLISNVEDIIEKDILRKLFAHINIANNQSYEIPHTYMTSIQESLWSMIENLHNVYVTLFTAAHIWDAHMQRTALAQKLTITSLEDLMTNNDAAQLNTEINFNIAIEQLRNISDAEKLQLHYEYLVSLLERAEDLYRNHNTSEQERLNSFMNLVPVMVNMFKFEFDSFLQKYNRVSLQSIGTIIQQQSTPSSRMRDSTTMAPLPRALLQAKLQEIVLQDFRNSFINAFETSALVTSIADAFAHQAQIWVDEKSADIRARHSLKMASHSVRLERLNAARDSRLAELTHHEARLDSHLEALYALIDRLPAEAAEFLDVDSPQLYPICFRIDRLHLDMNELLSRNPLDPEVKKLKVYSYAARLVRFRKLFDDSLHETLEKRKKEVAACAQQARVANFEFMSQVNLFTEGGRYAPQEATKVLALLVKGADALEISVLRTLEVLNGRLSYLLSLADNRMAPIQKVVEEIKPGNKNNKKSMPTRTKSKTK